MKLRYAIYWKSGSRTETKDKRVYWTGQLHPVKRGRKTSDPAETIQVMRAHKFQSPGAAYDYAASIAKRAPRLWRAQVGPV